MQEDGHDQAYSGGGVDRCSGGGRLGPGDGSEAGIEGRFLDASAPRRSPTPRPRPRRNRSRSTSAKLEALTAEFDAALYASGRRRSRRRSPASSFRTRRRSSRSSAPRRRRSSDFIRLMGFMKTDEAKQELRKLLGSPVAARRAAAASALGIARTRNRSRASRDARRPDGPAARQAAMPSGASARRRPTRPSRSGSSPRTP